MKLIDDSQEIISYYESFFENYSDKSVFSLLKELMTEWSIIVSSKKVTEIQFLLFEKAITHPNEKIWYESGSRFANCISLSENVKKTFIKLLSDRKSQVRLNIVSLLSCFDTELQNEIIQTAIKDKSIKVRMKLADSILRLQNEKHLEYLKFALKVETNPKVIESFNFTLQNFDKVKTDKHGSLILEIE